VPCCTTRRVRMLAVHFGRPCGRTEQYVRSHIPGSTPPAREGLSRLKAYSPTNHRVARPNTAAAGLTGVSFPCSTLDPAVIRWRVVVISLWSGVVLGVIAAAACGASSTRSPCRNASQQADVILAQHFQESIEAPSRGLSSLEPSAAELRALDAKFAARRACAHGHGHAARPCPGSSTGTSTRPSTCNRPPSPRQTCVAPCSVPAYPRPM